MSPRIVKILVSPVVMLYGNVENGIVINILLNAAVFILDTASHLLKNRM